MDVAIFPRIAGNFRAYRYAFRERLAEIEVMGPSR